MLPHLQDPSDAPGPAQGRGAGSVKTTQGPPGAPYLSPILSWCPIFSLGTQAVSQHAARPPQHRHRMGQGPHQGHGSERGDCLLCVPLVFMLDWGHRPLEPPGEPQIQAVFPLLTFLPLGPGLPSSPGLPWEEAAAVRDSPCVPQCTSNQGSPGPTAAPGCREGGAGHGVPHGTERLVLTGTPGGPRGPTVPGGPWSPRSPGRP